jgi:hypothetical protein
LKLDDLNGCLSVGFEIPDFASDPYYRRSLGYISLKIIIASVDRKYQTAERARQHISSCDQHYDTNSACARISELVVFLAGHSGRGVVESSAVAEIFLIDNCFSGICFSIRIEQ